MQVEGLKVIFDFLWDGIKAGWGLVGPIFDLMVDVIKNGIKGAIDIVINIWKTLWEGIQASWSLLKPIFDFIVDAIKKGIEPLVDPSEWGNSCPDRNFPQVFLHHRKKDYVL